MLRDEKLPMTASGVHNVSDSKRAASARENRATVPATLISGADEACLRGLHLPAFQLAGNTAKSTRSSCCAACFRSSFCAACQAAYTFSTHFASGCAARRPLHDKFDGVVSRIDRTFTGPSCRFVQLKASGEVDETRIWRLSERRLTRFAACSHTQNRHLAGFR